MALLFTYSRNIECPTCVYVAQVSVNTNHTATPEQVSWKCSPSVGIHLYLSRVRSAVMRSCGLAVMQG